MTRHIFSDNSFGIRAVILSQSKAFRIRVVTFSCSSDDPTSTLTPAPRDRLQQIFAQLPKKGLPRQSSIENTLRGLSPSSTMRSPSLRRTSISLLSLFTSLLISSVSSAPPPISVRLQASWQSPQLPLEILSSPSSINSDN